MGNTFIYLRRVCALLLLPMLAVCMLLASYSVSNKIDGTNYYKLVTPVGCVKVTDTLYYDETEISVANWHEYMYWTKKVFGEASKEYSATLPDSTVWDSRSTLNHYFFHDALYNDFPMVGISQQQASGYSKWRSDREFEYLLVTYGNMPFDKEQNAQTYFSVDKYFTGQYKHVARDTNFKYYPAYRLPTLLEWKTALAYAKPITSKFKITAEMAGYKEQVLKKTAWVYIPTLPVKSGSVMTHKHYIYNLQGNVSEWTSEANISAGGSWSDSLSTILAQDTFMIIGPDAKVGFRSVCTWKEYGK